MEVEEAPVCVWGGGGVCLVGILSMFRSMSEGFVKHSVLVHPVTAHLHPSSCLLPAVV